MSLTSEWQQRLIRLINILIGVTVLVAALSLWRWYQEGGGFEVIYVVIGVALTGLWALRRWLQPATQPNQPSSSAWGSVSLSSDESLITLRQQLEVVLTLDDLRLLAFHLNLNYDNLAGETLTRKILSLLHWCGANGRFPDLHTYLHEKYPRQSWAQPTLPTVGAHPRGQRNRENLLNHIQTTWIDGFLKQSIHSEVLKLSLNYRPEAVGQRPWQLVLQQTGQADQPVPPDRSLLDIFNSSGRNLLILGAPGSGKTITMLQLAEALVATARTNPAEPMPIVLNLSSWAREKRPLAEWLVEEIFVQYGVARDLTLAGVENNVFLYLLDGLDEVASEARADCLEAINQFKEAHPAEMMVCSRIEEYEALERTLHLGAAVQIRPLSDEQVQSYISQEELELQAVRATLNQDSDLRELARAPLMLSLMTLAYRGLSRADLQPLANKEARRRHLFDHYVRQMFVRRPLPVDTPYTQVQALQWLSNIARGMVKHEQSIFYIERLQPTWLEDGRLRRSYHLIGGLIGGLSFGLIVGLIVGLIGGLIVGLIVGLFLGFDSWSKNTVELGEVLTWHWPGMRRFFRAFVQGFIYGMMPGVISGIAGQFDLGFASTLLVGLLVGLIGGLIGGLIVGLIGECFERQETETRLVPNQSIRRAAWNAAMFTLLGALGGAVYGVILWLLDGCLGQIFCFLPYFEAGGGLGGGLLVGVPIGIGISLGIPFIYGLNTVIQHYVLRRFLAGANMLPYPFQDNRLVAYLNVMHERILLRRAGGGWIFVHRSLLEYFAMLDNDALPSS